MRWGKDRRDATIALKEKFGGKCVLCGYDKNYAALDFHHISPIEKSCGVSVASEKSKAEAEKCVLLCRNCHTDQHHPRYRRNVEERDAPSWIEGLRVATNVSPPKYTPPTAKELLTPEQYEVMMDHCDPERLEQKRVEIYSNFI